MGQIPGRRSHGQCLTLLIMNDDVTKTTNGGGGVVTQKNRKNSPEFEICGSVRFFGLQPPPPPPQKSTYAMINMINMIIKYDILIEYWCVLSSRAAL